MRYCCSLAAISIICACAAARLLLRVCESKAGNAIAARMAMMATVIISSIRVKPRFFCMAGLMWGFSRVVALLGFGGQRASAADERFPAPDGRGGRGFRAPPPPVAQPGCAIIRGSAVVAQLVEQLIRNQ